MLVVDASVAIKFVMREVGTDEARKLLAIPDRLIAPDWLLVEAASTFWKKATRSELSIEQAYRNLAVLPRFFDTLHPASELAGEALRWALRLQHSVYDCLYVALALQEGAGLVTADAKLATAAGQTELIGRVQLIG